MLLNVIEVPAALLDASHDRSDDDGTLSPDEGEKHESGGADENSDGSSHSATINKCQTVIGPRWITS